MDDKILLMPNKFVSGAQIVLLIFFLIYGLFKKASYLGFYAANLTVFNNLLVLSLACSLVFLKQSSSYLKYYVTSIVSVYLLSIVCNVQTYVLIRLNSNYNIDFEGIFISSLLVSTLLFSILFRMHKTKTNVCLCLIYLISPILISYTHYQLITELIRN